MVLHHVAQRAGAVIKRAALFHAQLFGNGDLDVGNVLAPPERLEQRIAKAQRKQVLHRRFAQVVVDAENLLLRQHAAHSFVDGAVRGQVVAQRLFQHHAGLRAVQSGGRNLLADRGEQAGCRGQIHHHHIGRALVQPGRQGGVVRRVGQVHAQVAEHLGKARKLFFAGAFGQLDAVKARLDECAVLFVRQIVTRHAHDAALRRERAVAKSLEQGRHDFSPGQVAGAAKQDQVKAHGKELEW